MGTRQSENRQLSKKDPLQISLGFDFLVYGRGQGHAVNGFSDLVPRDRAPLDREQKFRAWGGAFKISGFGQLVQSGEPLGLSMAPPQ